MAQSDVYGLRKAVTKQIDLTIAQYDGTAKDGELLIDMNPGNTQYMIFVGMEDGYVTDLIANNAVNANNANFAGNVTIANQPNITTVGTLTNLAVAGNASIGGNAVITGNLNVEGDITYINITDLQIQDPIILLGGGANGAPLTANDGKDRGTQLQVFDTGVGAPVPKFMGWDNSAEQFILGSNVTNTVDVITVNTYGNLRLDTLLGSNIAVTGNVQSFDISAANSVVAVADISAGANISATADITAGGNVSVTGNIDAIGNITGDYISATTDLVAGGNVSATGNVVSSANIDGVNFNASGNMVATGNVTGGNVTTGGQVVATGNVVSSANIDGVNFNASGNMVATGNVSGQNIAATANLSSGNLTVTTGNVDFTTTANVSLGAVANLHVSGGVSGQVLRTDGAGVLSWVDANTAPGGAGANTQVIFNDAGVMGAVSTFTYDKATDILSVVNLSVAGEVLTDLIPFGNKVYDLGNATNRWGNIYLSNNSLYLGAVHVTSDDVSVVNIPNVEVAGNVVAANIVTTSTNVNFSNATTFTVGANTSLSGTGLQSDVFISRADTAATSTLDCGTADYFKYTVSGATTFTATNVPAAGRLCSILLEIVNGGSAAVTWFSGTKWASATPPTLTAAGTDVLGFYTTDGGTSWIGLVLGLNIS